MLLVLVIREVGVFVCLRRFFRKLKFIELWVECKFRVFWVSFVNFVKLFVMVILGIGWLCRYFKSLLVKLFILR